MRRTLSTLALLALLSACEGATDPAAEPAISAAKGGRLAATDITSGSTTGTTAETPTGSPLVASFIPGSPPLKTYDTTFAAHQGWRQNFVIFHEDGNYFMVLDVPNSAQFVRADGTPLEYGEPFGLRAVVDDQSVSFEFQPHGSSFTGSRPVVLWVYLKYVDLGSAGTLPKVWYQAESTDPWTETPTEVDRAGKWLKIELHHFSNYAVAW